MATTTWTNKRTLNEEMRPTRTNFFFIVSIETGAHYNDVQQARVFFFFGRHVCNPVKGEQKQLIVVLVIIFSQGRISGSDTVSPLSLRGRHHRQSRVLKKIIKQKFQKKKNLQTRPTGFFGGLNVVHSFRKSKWKFRESSGERVWALHIRDERTFPFLRFNFSSCVCVACFVIPGRSRGARANSPRHGWPNSETLNLITSDDSI